ncbi:hypothetical protein PoB_002693400 [Plakobranchus ocellatus]|uniref:Uncharacterized protein n=1 Tax=Plakobranchus ocellatus TaxID=259542 RepID=A0AAV4A1G6_9GAST|nr:hypothetical protein PoB_002693400 [Plakobranchus ocellatus]
MRNDIHDLNNDDVVEEKKLKEEEWGEEKEMKKWEEEVGGWEAEEREKKETLEEEKRRGKGGEDCEPVPKRDDKVTWDPSQVKYGNFKAACPFIKLPKSASEIGADISRYASENYATKFCDLLKSPCISRGSVSMRSGSSFGYQVRGQGFDSQSRQSQFSNAPMCPSSTKWGTRSLKIRRKYKRRGAMANYLKMPYVKNNQDPPPGSVMFGLSVGPTLLVSL